jgi:uncharacterized RDD family membrane protein YckC
MRCPKCHYLSFEPEARCRNCGNDLALSDDDLVIKAPDEHDDVEGPLADFDLRTPAVPARPMTLGPIHAVSAAAPVPAAVSAVSVAPAPRAVRPPSTTAELPLFMKGLPEAGLEPDTPVAQVPNAPRAPLMVRRSSEAVSESPRADRSSMAEMAAHMDSVWAPLATPLRAEPAPVEEPSIEHADHVGLLARAAAGALDLLLLGGIDLMVVWLTVRLCAVTFGQVLSLPLVPLAAFVLLIDVGYLFLFAATTGQTLGKMAAGIRVVGSPSGDDLEPLSLRQAIVRSLATVPSVVALGAGFIPALGGEGLAVHDRLARTRVVRA